MTGAADLGGPRAGAALHDLGQLLLADLSPPSVLQRIVELVQRAMPVGSEVSITLVRDDLAATAAFTDPVAEVLDETQYERGYGPCLDAALGGVFTGIDDARAEVRWPAYVPVLLEHGALSALAVPVPAPHLTAALNVYGRTAWAFADVERSVLVQFAAYAGAAQTNMDALQDARELAEGMQEAMRFRSTIEQAKGILLERHKVTVDEAFRLLADASMRTNRKVRDIAEDLVRTGELATAPPTRTSPATRAT